MSSRFYRKTSKRWGEGKYAAQPCQGPSCERKAVWRRKLCVPHSEQHLASQTLTVIPRKHRKNIGVRCSVPECTRMSASNEICAGHLRRKYRGEPDWYRPIRPPPKRAESRGMVSLRIVVTIPTAIVASLESAAGRRGAGLEQQISDVLEWHCREIERVRQRGIDEPDISREAERRVGDGNHHV